VAAAMTLRTTALASAGTPWTPETGSVIE